MPPPLCQATFEDSLLEEAQAKKHCTTREAVEAGAAAGAYRTLLTHFSQRYPKIPVVDENFQVRRCDARTALHSCHPLWGVGLCWNLPAVRLADGLPARLAKPGCHAAVRLVPLSFRLHQMCSSTTRPPLPPGQRGHRV